jgi:hypothetical protein
MATKSKFHTQDGIKTLGNAEIDGSLTVSGNFTVNGDTNHYRFHNINP